MASKTICGGLWIRMEKWSMSIYRLDEMPCSETLL
jgi:hypothetical protein